MGDVKIKKLTMTLLTGALSFSVLASCGIGDAEISPLDPENEKVAEVTLIIYS